MLDNQRDARAFVPVFGRGDRKLPPGFVPNPDLDPID